MSLAARPGAASAGGRRPTRQRAWWCLAALVPGLVATAVIVDPTITVRLVAVLVVAMAVDAAAARLRGGPAIDPASWLVAVLVALMLPAASPWGVVGTAAIVAAVASRGLWASASAAPVHPAMLAVGAVGLAMPDAGLAPATTTPWLAIAWLAGAAALVALRVLRGTAALAMLAAFLVGLAVSTPDPVDAVRAALADGRIVLVAGFVATAPASGALTPTGRGIVGAGIGLAASLAGPEQAVAALPYAVLLMNGLAPLVDRAVDALRPPRTDRTP